MTMVVVMVAALHWRHGPVRRYGQSAGRRTAAQTEGDYISGAAALCRREPGVHNVECKEMPAYHIGHRLRNTTHSTILFIYPS